MKNIFIVLEGPDGSGTTRHSSILAARLIANGYNVLVTAEPTKSSIGMTIRNILHSEDEISPETLQLLFCADRAQHIEYTIKPALDAGKIVISDRYTLSTIAYGSAQGISGEWLKSINDHFIKPDLTFIALPPFNVGMDRIKKRHENDRFENETFQKKVYDEYEKHKSNDSVVIDTSGSKKDSADKIIQNVLKVFTDLKLPKTLDNFEI